jgi:hypothetical protein
MEMYHPIVSGRLGFFASSAAWVAGLVLVPVCYQLLIGPPLESSWTAWQTAYLLLTWAGLFLPYAGFAGGLRAFGDLPARSVPLRGCVLAVLAFGLLAYGSPLAKYQADEARGADMAARYPFGPNTPGGLQARRSAADSIPPGDIPFSVERPLEAPPNWLTYLIHSLFAVSCLAILFALLGWQAGSLTSGLSPPARRNARWALGLASGILFFAAQAAGGEWVRMDSSNSGMLGAWLPLLVPVFELAFLMYLARRRGGDLHISASAYV